MRNLIICDDEPAICETLCGYAERMLKELDLPMQIKVYTSAEALLASPLEDSDILLLDIKMGAMTGMDAARRLRAQRSQVCIIFVTSMTQYAMEGYEVHAFGFLKKPMQYERFYHVVHEALESVAVQAEKQITVNSGFTRHIVSTSDILYIEAIGHDVTVVTTKARLSTGTSLTEFESMLKDKEFFRCHKGFLISFRHIRSIQQKDAVMTDGFSVPISKHRRKEFLESFARYEGGRV